MYDSDFISLCCSKQLRKVENENDILLRIIANPYWSLCAADISTKS